MKVLIPIGGTGERFSKDGYKNPKPLINVLGKPMICWVIESLKLTKEDQLIIVHRDELNHYNFKELLQNSYPQHNIKFVELSFNTRGAAETVLHGLKQIESTDLEQPIMLCDCDTFYEDDVVSDYKNEGGNCIFYFNDTGDKPIFSYITFDDGKVTSIKEKEKISDNANTGLYCFRTTSLLKQYCEILLDSPTDSKELYISEIYRKMLENNETITAIKVDKFHCIGTPFQLQLFATNNIKLGEKQRFCFDFDNTLVTFPKVKNDYSTVEPLQNMINFAKFLKSQGHTIIIHTARRMKTHKGNVGSVIADIGPVTLETIKKFGIPCDELYFGKPYADFYIDDKAVNPFQDHEKEMGFYNNNIEAREFNSVKITDTKVIKTSSSETFQGELYWYRYIPIVLRDLFPSYYIEENSNTLTLEKINGITLSQILVNGDFKDTHLELLLSAMERIHSKEFITESLEKLRIYQTFPNKFVYENYHTKLVNRFDAEYYKQFQNSDIVYSILLDFLRNYEIKSRAEVRIIHGDPVFTNIFIEPNKNIKFIDMRGMQGKHKTIYGDMFYDYAKIYQSLVGYDFVLHGKKLNSDYLEPLKEQFKNYIENKYDAVRFQEIRMITKSLLFTLLPLHKNNKCQDYYDLMHRV
jgi:capsule biosynthesis phosphatase